MYTSRTIGRTRHPHPFTRGPNTNLIAAVGKNTGSTSDHAYVVGFGLGVDLLLRAMREGGPGSSEAVAYVDGLIYPVGYCARHYIELFMKSAATTIHGLRRKKSKSSDVHDLLAIWKMFAELCKQDRRLHPYAHRLKPLIRTFAKLDRTGQAFRYRVDLKNRLHLKEVGVINIETFAESFYVLKEIVDDFTGVMEVLEWEYGCGTFTDKLSRADLFDIAKQFAEAYAGGRPGWMNKIKKTVMKRYHLTNSEFEQAEGKIEQHRKLSLIIGVEKKLDEVTPETMGALAIVMAIEEDWDLLSNLEWAGLRGIIEAMGPTGCCEGYEPMLRKCKRKLVIPSPPDIVRSIKRNPSQFSKALEKLGQPTLVDAFALIRETH